MTTKILFIHHSTGGLLIHQGKVREQLKEKAPEIEFWDHGYNLYKHFPQKLADLAANKLTFHTGLSDARGNQTGKDFNINLTNNNPGDFEAIFTAGSESGTELGNTLKNILDFDVIAFKNCFPTTKIDSTSRLEKYIKNYIAMRESFKKYPQKLFIPFTPPPLRKSMTKPEYATRAQDFAKWLKSEDFLKNQKNIAVFDFFNLLADEGGYLKPEYCNPLFFDSHPNKKANELNGKKFVQFLVDQITSFSTN